MKWWKTYKTLYMKVRAYPQKKVIVNVSMDNL